MLSDGAESAADPVWAEDLLGWLPIRIDPESDVVRWVDFRGATLDDAFLHDTARTLEQRGARVAFTDLEALSDVAEICDPLEPSAFVFHVSRCGSTLLASMLKRQPGCLVISEPNAVTDILMAARRGLSDASVRSLLVAAMRLLGQRRRGETRYVVKLTSWCLLDLELIAELFPGVPWIFVYRDPLEVMVSNLREPGYWMGLYHADRASAAALTRLAAPLLDATSAEEYCALVLRSLFSAGLSGHERAVLVEYRELLAGLPGRVAHALGFEVTAELQREVQGVLARHSKKAANEFRSDIQDKQAVASDEARRHAATHVAELYAACERTREQQIRDGAPPSDDPRGDPVG